MVFRSESLRFGAKRNFPGFGHCATEVAAHSFLWTLMSTLRTARSDPSHSLRLNPLRSVKQMGNAKLICAEN